MTSIRKESQQSEPQDNYPAQGSSETITHTSESPSQGTLSGGGESHPPQTPCDQGKCNKRERDAFDYLTLGVNSLTLIAVVVYAFFAHQQVNRMQTANDMNLAVLRGTKAASFDVGIDPDWSKGNVSLVFMNQGELAPRDISGEFTIIRQSFPEYRTLHSDTYFFSQDVALSKDVNFFRKGPYLMVGFTRAEHQAITDTREIVIIAGAIGYNDGIKEGMSQKFCKSFAIFNDPARDTRDFRDCEQRRQMLDALLQERRKSQE